MSQVTAVSAAYTTVNDVSTVQTVFKLSLNTVLAFWICDITTQHEVKTDIK